MNNLDRSIRRVAIAMVVLMLILVVQLTHLQVVDSTKLADDPQNIRTTIHDFARARGEILSADGDVLARSVVAKDQFKRQRDYPQGALDGYVTGYFSFIYGSTGIEHTYDNWLNGSNPALALHNVGDLLTGKDLVGNVVLNLSDKVQRAAQAALGTQQGSVIVLNARTGAVVGLYSSPGYDPNLLSNHSDQEVQHAAALLQLNPENPLLARSYRERYPPGSTFKIVTAAAALDTGAATPDTPVFPVLKSLPLPDTNGQTLNNFGGESCGGTLTQSLIQSCNTTFGQLGLTLGDALTTQSAQWGVGLGQPAPPIDLPNPASSVGPAPGSFQQNKPAFAKDAIGQQDIAVTPLEMALIAAGIANGGVIMQPQVVKEIRGANDEVAKTFTPVKWKTGTSAATAAALTQMMLGVVQSGTGTAAQIPGIQVAGKTGTAQNGTPTPDAWFVGFAPVGAAPDQPEYAFAVLVEHGGTLRSEATGGAVAAPIAKAVLRALLP
jgi:peptidoglycan glycosyltransferase